MLTALFVYSMIFFANRDYFCCTLSAAELHLDNRQLTARGNEARCDAGMERRDFGSSTPDEGEKEQNLPDPSALFLTHPLQAFFLLFTALCPMR